MRLAGCAERIEHIPKVLYLWRSHTASVSKNSNTSSYVADAAKRAVLEHLRQQGIVAAIQSSPLQTTAFKINYELAVWNVSCHTQEEKEYFELLKDCKNIHVVNGYIVGAGKVW